MFITVRMDKNYGIETVYPFCEQAKLFAKIAGTKTLTRNTLRDVQLLGYEIVIAQENYKTFQNLITA
jgi:hypothetical protein